MKLLNTAPEIYELKPAGNTLFIPTYAITQTISCGYGACYIECRGKQTWILNFLCILVYALGAVTYLTDISLSFWNL